METSPLGGIEKTAAVKRAISQAAVEPKDTMQLSPAAIEAQKIASWVDMLKEMPYIRPEQALKESSDVLKTVTSKILDEFI